MFLFAYFESTNMFEKIFSFGKPLDVLLVILLMELMVFILWKIYVKKIYVWASLLSKKKDSNDFGFAIAVHYAVDFTF